jgi:SPP1 gp7 family putative phage head morphogenesis protein
MPLVTKARKKNDPALRDPSAGLNKAERDIYEVYLRALEGMRNDLDDQNVLRAVREAVEAGQPLDGGIAFKWQEFITSLQRSVPQLAQQLAASANVSKKTLPKRISYETSFEATDPRAIAWAQQRAGARIAGITQESQKAVAEIIANGLRTKLSRDQVIRQVTEIVGLDTRQARALANFYEKNLLALIEEGMPFEKAEREALKLSKEYRQRLLVQRATRIARTETLAAANAGRMLSWQEADAQGLLPPGSMKRWKTAADERTCVVCGPLNNQEVAWNTVFATGDMMPPVHPNCRCTAVIVPGEPVFIQNLEKSVEKRYYRFADGEKTWRNYDYRWRKIATELKRKVGKCQRCGSKSDLTVDHKKRLKDGGAKYDRKNLRVLCRSCNGKLARLGTKLRKDSGDWLLAKHLQGKHDQKTHGRGGSASAFYQSGGSISDPLDWESEKLAEAQITLETMGEMLGDEFSKDEGVKFTKFALEPELGDTKVRIAQTEDGLAGAISYMEMGKEELEITYGDFATEMNPQIYISYLGSTGLIDKTGTALAMSVFEEAASRNLGIFLESASDSASAFWKKMGLEATEGFADDILSASPEKVKELVGA